MSVTADPPRVWWCVTGPLTFLPIHAAGIYNENTTGSGFNISDYVVSSYTPTLNAIINATGSHKASQTFQGLLAVCQQNTPGQSPLPNTKVELTQIQQLATNVDIHPLEGAAASVEKCA